MEKSSRYLIGIDLGTTNSVVAYVDAQQPRAPIQIFKVPQLVNPGDVRVVPALPSFLYFPTSDELQEGLFSLPWDEHPQAVAGVIAREHGALMPARQVMSAKSWLSHSGVDRKASILPRDARPPLTSPLDASAQYLKHLRDAWNLVFASESASDSCRFEKQEVVLTVPASFDEEARELTVEAAQMAGLTNFVLLEEPLAAFYAWISSHGQRTKEELHNGDLVLVCDIGGGTTDLSLMRAQASGEELRFERTAIGEHLLLGGDNLDLALARTVEQRLKGPKLSMRQRHALQRTCCAAKERLLSHPDLESVAVTVLGSGRAVVGQMLTTELHRNDVLELLTTGFLPIVPAGDIPRPRKSAGLRELGLPYAEDPAITRHIATFLQQAGSTMRGAANNSGMVRPDALLFNGGFCEPALVRDRVLEAVSNWFPEVESEWRPKVLSNHDVGGAVATGAAHYARVRRGLGTRIRAGSPRTYYIALRSAEGSQGVCILPAGIEEGSTLPPLNREFAALANRPVSFTLLSSRTRHDARGEVANLSEEQVHRHAPLTTVLRYGKKMREQELAVRLSATFTELGTLELWCESASSPHRWRLQFELRDTRNIGNGEEVTAKTVVATAASPMLADQAVQAAVRLVHSAFAAQPGDNRAESPDTLAARLEALLNAKRDAWPTAVIRVLADALISAAAGRTKSPQHEARWLNLAGFCLRPGFGAPGDERRVGDIRKLFASGLAFPVDVQSQVQWLTLLRRLAGGIHSAHQHELYQRLLPTLEFGPRKKRGRLNPQVEYETWRFLSSLEYLPANLRTRLGDELVTRVTEDSRWMWPLARVGARIPLYGPLLCVISPERVSDWLTRVLDLSPISPEVMHAVLELARYTGDRTRDMDSESRTSALRALRAAGAQRDVIEKLSTFVPPDRADAVRMFGESLPGDLPLVSSATCLLSVAALNPGPQQAA